LGGIRKHVLLLERLIQEAEASEENQRRTPRAVQSAGREGHQRGVKAKTDIP